VPAASTCSRCRRRRGAGRAPAARHEKDPCQRSQGSERSHFFFGLGLVFFFACARSLPATVFSPLVDLLFPSSLPAPLVALFPVGLLGHLLPFDLGKRIPRSGCRRKVPPHRQPSPGPRARPPARHRLTSCAANLFLHLPDSTSLREAAPSGDGRLGQVDVPQVRVDQVDAGQVDTGQGHHLILQPHLSQRCLVASHGGPSRSRCGTSLSCVATKHRPVKCGCSTKPALPRHREPS
jgi:hypothetical protein